MDKYTRLAQFLFTLSLLFLETSFGLTGNKTLCLDKERDALLEFKRGLTDFFDHLSTWGDEQDKQECCKWKGIECDRRTGHVTVLDLHNEFTCSTGASACSAPRLTGKLSPSLLELEYLHFLDLSVNDFEKSEIPRFIGSLKRLQYLNLTSLTSIDLLYNQLIGQIDDRFGTLMYLEHLNLANNFKIKGGVPSSFGNLTRLRHLNMFNTETGQWLPELFLRLSGSRKSLEILGLNDNSLFGSIVNVTRFSSLKKLYLQKNMLNGSFMESAGQVSTLKYLDLSYNHMRGALPDLALFPSLRELHLGSNQFQGRIPQGIGKLSQLRILDVSTNRLEG
ncbi:hypothetical protein KY289_030056 [Solanum tuberosum]|nr:hypothetical protein KY289_030056 [Solanum tuberosum]